MYMLENGTELLMLLHTMGATLHPLGMLMLTHNLIIITFMQFCFLGGKNIQHSLSISSVSGG